MKNKLSNIKKSLNLLNQNECIAIPTETVYGLGANAYSDIASKKIFNLKKRNKKNPLIVHYYDLKMVNNDCIINKNFIKLYKALSPGPVTFILKLKKRSRISKYVTNNKKNLGVRFPLHKLTRKLLKNLKYPLAAPSANISSKISPVCKSDVKEEFGKKIKYILDGGKCKIGLESTIIDLTSKPKILRLGGVDIEKINSILGIKISYSKFNTGKVPGRSKLHYSPGIPIRLNALHPKLDEAFILIKKRNKSSKKFFYLSKKNNLREAAKNLYATLRMIKRKNFKKIAVERIKNKGIGAAINDRLTRASKN